MGNKIIKEKEDVYLSLLPQVKSLIKDETDIIANLANICAVLKEKINFFWVGFYLNKENELVLGPFQGPLACTRIALGKGVCGISARKKKTIIVDDVHQFENHIACNINSKSEIVIPLVVNDTTSLVLDIDSDEYKKFDKIDQKYLEEIIDLIKFRHFS